MGQTLATARTLVDKDGFIERLHRRHASMQMIDRWHRGLSEGTMFLVRQTSPLSSTIRTYSGPDMRTRGRLFWATGAPTQWLWPYSSLRASYSPLKQTREPKLGYTKRGS